MCTLVALQPPGDIIPQKMIHNIHPSSNPLLIQCHPLMPICISIHNPIASRTPRWDAMWLIITAGHSHVLCNPPRNASKQTPAKLACHDHYHHYQITLSLLELLGWRQQPRNLISTDIMANKPGNNVVQDRLRKRKERPLSLSSRKFTIHQGTQSAALYHFCEPCFGALRVLCAVLT